MAVRGDKSLQIQVVPLGRVVFQPVIGRAMDGELEVSGDELAFPAGRQ